MLLTSSGLAGLSARCAAVDGHAPFEEHTLLTLDGPRQLPHARLERFDGDRLVGCAVLSEGVDGWTVEAAVAPDRRGQGLGRELVRQARDHVASHGGGVLRAWLHGDAAPARALAADASLERRLLVLQRDLADPPPVVVPDGLHLRTLDPAADRDAWLALSNAAFAGHPDNGGWTRADLDWRLEAAWTAAARFPVLVGPTGLVAGVWTKVEPGSRDGELHVVAVDPRAQGRGLGRVVVAAALSALVRAGCGRAVLYVDADNTAAVRLYRGAGFRDGLEHHLVALQVPAAG